MRIKTGSSVVMSVAIFTIIAMLYKGAGLRQEIGILFGATSFVFGITIAFLLTSRTNRLVQIRDVFNEDNANYVTIYSIASIFGKAIQTKLQKRLDDYLISQLDYFIADFIYTKDEFDKVIADLISIKPKTQEQMSVYNSLLQMAHEMHVNRLRVISLARDRLSPYEWFVAISLAMSVLISIFYMNSNTFISQAISVLLATAVVALVFVLRDIDTLSWKEEEWNWAVINETFIEIDLLPYYPDDILKSSKAKVAKRQKIRIATYTKPYPNMAGKVVKIKTM